MADGTLIFDTKIDNSGVKKSLQDIKKQVNSMGNTVREFQLVITPTIKAKIEKDAIKQAVQATNEQLKNAYATSGLSMNMTPKLDLSKIEPNIQKFVEILTPLADVITRAFPTASIENFTNALRNLSTQSIDFSALKTQIQGFTDMLTPLSSQLSTAFSGEGFTQLNTIVGEINQLSGSITVMRTALDGMGTAMTTAFNVQAVQGFSEAFKSIDINLVTTQAEKLKTALEPLANTMQQAFNTEHITACAGAIERLSNAVSGLSENTNLPRLSEPIQQTSENLERSQKGISKFRDTGLSAVNSLAKSFSRLENIVRSVFSTAVVVNFGKQAVQTASQLSNAMTGLKSIVEGQGRSYSTANKFIQDYISDGLVPLQNAVTAYKNLASRGYSDEQIQKVMESLKNSATYGRQASLTLGYAVQSATEGIKNENSILVDNAGVTKNVSVMWKEYAQSIGKSYTELTKQEKIQAEVNGIIEETKFQMGDAEKASNTFMGQTAKLSASFTNLKVAIGNTIIPALQRIIPVIKSVVQKLTEFFTKMALYSELFFGIKKASNTATAGTDKAVSSTNALADAQENVADATADANKELKNNLASMDELNILESETTDKEASGSDSGLNFSGLTDTEVEVKDKIDPQIALKIEQLRGKIEQLIKTAKQKFKELWETLKPFRNFVSRGIEDFYNGFLKPLGKWTIGKGLPQLDKIFKDFNNNLNFEPLNKALETLWTNLENLGESAGNGLLWLLKEVFSPLSEWAVETLLPATVELLANAIDLLTKSVKAVSSPFKKLYEAIILPFAKTVESLAVGAIESLSKSLEKLSLWISSNPDIFGKTVIGLGAFVGGIVGAITAVKGITSIIGVLKGVLAVLPAILSLITSPLGLIVIAIGAVVAGMALLVTGSEDGKNAVLGFFDSIKNIATAIWDNTLKPIFDNVAEQANWIWEKHLKPIGKKLLDFFQSLLEFWNNVISPVVSKFFESLKTSIVPTVNFCVDVIGTAISTVIDIIGGIIDTLRGVLDFITGVFTGDAEKAFKGLGKTFTGLIDIVLGVVKGLLNIVIDTLNFIITPINSMFKDIGSLMGKDIAEIPEIKIPKLATGTVVPANYGEFVAMLGDNKRETEVVSPLSTIKQALYEALSEAGGIGGGDITIPIYIGNSLLDKYVITAQQRRNAITNGWR